jgi:hypothetical protein
MMMIMMMVLCRPISILSRESIGHLRLTIELIGLKFRVLWDILPCSQIDLTRRYIPEDSELHTRRQENLKCHIELGLFQNVYIH